MQPNVFFCFLTDFEKCKKYALFHNHRIQRNIKKSNQNFGYGNRISFIFSLKAIVEMSGGRLYVSFFSGRQNISYNEPVDSSGQFIKNQVKLFIMYRTFFL